jgi:hypothetical protein
LLLSLLEAAMQGIDLLRNSLLKCEVLIQTFGLIVIGSEMDISFSEILSDLQVNSKDKSSFTPALF